MIYLWCFLFFLIGVLLGAVLTRPKPDGTIVINTTDPDKDVYSLELDISLTEVPVRRTVVFRVRTK